MRIVVGDDGACSEWLICFSVWGRCVLFWCAKFVDTRPLFVWGAHHQSSISLSLVQSIAFACACSQIVRSASTNK